MSGLRAFIALALLTRVIFLKEIVWRDRKYIILRVERWLKAIPVDF
jgi:hypothetical protein